MASLEGWELLALCPQVSVELGGCRAFRVPCRPASMNEPRVGELAETYLRAGWR